MIKIFVDTSQTSDTNYGFGDGRFENIIQSSLLEVDIKTSGERIRKYIANYRFNGRGNDYVQKSLERIIDTVGIEETIPLPFVYDHETADRILDYMGDDSIASNHQINFAGKKYGTLDKNSRITMNVPHLGINSDWQVIDIAQFNDVYRLSVKRYSSDKYSYSASPSLPADESYPIAPDFENTPPDPVSGITVTGSYDLTEVKDRRGILTVSFTPPDDGNYASAIIAIRETGAGSYVPHLSAYDGGVIRGLKLNQAYDVQVISISPAGNPGLGIEKLSTTITANTAAPGTPTTPTIERTGRVWTVRGVAPSSTHPIDYYIWEVDPPTGSNYEFKSDSLVITINASGTTTVSARARFKAVNIYGTEGAYSNYSNSQTSEQWQQQHLATNSVGNTQVQADAIDHLKIDSLEVWTANINSLAATNAKLGTASVDSGKRIGVFNGSQGVTLGNVLQNRVIKGTVTVPHGLGIKPIVAIRFSAASVDASDRLHRAAMLTAVGTSSFSIHWEVGNHGGLGELNAGTGTFEWWYW